MKRLLSILAFLTIVFTASFAQGNGQGNGNGGYGNNSGNSNSGWAGYWPNWVISWLENGGTVPTPLAVAVIHEARAWGQQNYGLNQGQMIVKYFQGSLTVEYVPTVPPSLVFRLRYGGSDVIVVLVDL